MRERPGERFTVCGSYFVIYRIDKDAETVRILRFGTAPESVATCGAIDSARVISLSAAFLRKPTQRSRSRRFHPAAACVCNSTALSGRV